MSPPEFGGIESGVLNFPKELPITTGVAQNNNNYGSDGGIAP